MKKILFLCLLAITFLPSQAVNRMVIKPYIEGMGLRGWKVDSILLSDTATVVYCHFGLGKGWTASGDTDGYIEIPATGKRYKKTELRGELPKSPKFAIGDNKPIKFESIFPPIDPNTKVINITDKEFDGGSAVWYGIWLVPHTTVFSEALATLPDLQGKWFASDGSGKWEAAFYEKKVFWNNQFWDFKVLKSLDKKATLELSITKDKKQIVELEMVQDSLLTVTANRVKHTLKNRMVVDLSNKTLFSNVFSKNDSITVSGYYQVVHPNFYKQAAILVPDLISDKPLVYPIKFNADCTFSVTLPLLHTAKVTFSNQFGYQNALSEVSFMAEPGNHIVLSYINEDEKGVIFGGDNELVNNEMQAFTGTNPYFVTEKSMTSKIKDGIEKFIPWRIDFQQKMKSGFATWLTTHKVSAKMDAYMKCYLKYALVSDLAKTYGFSKNSKEGTDFIPSVTDTAFYNNPDALYLPDYTNFLLAVKVRNMVAANRITTGQISKYLQENVSPTVSEIKLLAEMDSCEIKLTSKEGFDSFKKFITNNKAPLDSLFRKYNLDILNYRNLLAKEAELKFTLPNGFGKELLAARECGNVLAKEESVLTATQLENLKINCKIPELVELVLTRNYVLDKKIEQSKTAKLPKGLNIFTLPEDTKDVIENISKKYKGKVIYIDFWATWCGPCKAEFPYAEKHKENFKGQNVTFVYIAGDSSPEAVWKKMIATIPGEHYKLSKKQWEGVVKKFNFSTIPHYMLIDRKGKIISDNATRPSAVSKLNEEINILLK